ncbi:membrane bound O-acyl transferase family-domain-containing protein [Cyathus striatus]|nr:membrane bound O-acyl transferase family-domain-containing protein [Cyathus striatus]
MLSITAHSYLLSTVLILGLASKPTRYHPIYFILVLSIFSSILITPFPDEDPGTKYQAGIISVVLGASLDYFVLSDPQQSSRRKGDDKPASERSFWERVKWAATLLTNPRGANWNCAVPGLRYPSYSTRRQFVMTRLGQAAAYFLFADVVAFVSRRIPALQYPPSESLGAHGFLWQLVNVMLFWMTLVGYMGMPHTLGSAITVAAGILDPEEWPVYFGPWLQTTSIRTFWGKTWHQSFRRSIQPQAKYLTQRILHLSPGLLSRYIQLFTCFFLSGLYHAAADWAMSHDPHSIANVFKYFVLQAVAVTVEDFILYLGKKIGVTSVPRVVSYTWVLGWMGLSGPLWIETIVEGGVFSYFGPPMSVSVVERMFG